MDPASIGLAVFSILGLTKATAKLARTMCIVFRDKDGNILAEIAESVNRLKTHSGVIETAVQGLERKVKNYSELAVVQKLKEGGHIKGIGLEAKVLKRDMNAVEKRIKSVRWIPEVQWVLRMKAKVDALIPLTTSVQCLLHLAIATISQDITRSLPPPQDERLAEFVQEMFKQQQEEVEDRVSELQRLSKYSLAYSEEGSSNRAHLNKLEKLASDMVALADEFGATSSAPLQSLSGISQRAGATGTSDDVAYRSNSSRPTSVQSQTVSASTLSSMSGFDSEPLTSSRPISISRPSPNRRTGSGSSSASPSMVSVDITGSPDSSADSEALAGSSENHGIMEGYCAIWPTSREMILDRTTDRYAVSGFISSDDHGHGRIHITARRDESLAENLMSLSAAQRLSLALEEEDGLDRVVFEDNTSTKVVGRVVKAFAWMHGKGLPVRVKVSFWVCEHLAEDIILGAPFHDRETHLRKGRNRS